MGADLRDERRIALACLSERSGFGERGFFRASCNGCTAVDEDWQGILVI